MSIAYLFYGAYRIIASLGALWWQPVGEGLVAYDLARLAALLGLPFILLQPVLAARLPLLDRIVPFDRMMRWHRITGMIGTSFILAHATLLVWYYGQFGLDLALEFITPGLKWETLGSVSLSLLLLTVFLALLRKLLRLPYHWWKRLHLLVYLSVFGGALHALMLGSDVAAQTGLRYYFITLMVISALAILYRRVIAPLLARLRPYQVVTSQEIVTGVRHFVLKPQRGQKISHRPGQFAFIKFKAHGLSGEWHPFTISSAPSESQLTFSIKASGDWTSQLPAVLPGDTVYIEGPFGQFSYNASTRLLVAIAGGIGITPLHSMIAELITQHDPRSITLLYANKRQADIAFKEQFDELAKSNAQQFKVVHVLSRAETNDTVAHWQGETGHVSSELIKKYVTEPAAAEYYICGPKPMMQATIKVLRDLGVPRQQIHFELFALV